ncbi:nitroreductase family protein [Candidatus Fermentibacteria bacterium]|nr:nitroreductase family protein [Candidatus Fermentibacteria bacterium]
MHTIEAITSRRSVRKFTPQPVPQAAIREMLDAAMHAPSAGNQQPWQFVVIDDRTLLDQVPSFSPYAAMAKEAQVGILVCGDTSLEEYPGFWIQDCSAAVQNILLAAHAQGLGAVWTGVHPAQDREEGFRRLLGLPDHVVPLAFVPIGHPAHVPAPQIRYREDRVHWNGWQETR